jgi:hypothetical protein
MMRRFYISRSGRHYVSEGELLFHYDRENSRWERTARTLTDVQSEGRLREVDSHDDFVHYARRAYETQMLNQDER